MATARITPDGAYGDLKSHSGFDFWTHIVATSDGILLFDNYRTGDAATGVIDEVGNHADLRNTTLDRGWQIIVPTTNGLPFFYRTDASSAAVIGRIDAHGVCADVSLVNGLDRWTTSCPRGNRPRAQRHEPALVFYRRGRLSLDLNFKNVTNDTYVNANGTFVFRRRQE